MVVTTGPGEIEWSASGAGRHSALWRPSSPPLSSTSRTRLRIVRESSTTKTVDFTGRASSVRKLQESNHGPKYAQSWCKLLELRGYRRHRPAAVSTGGQVLGSRVPGSVQALPAGRSPASERPP